MTVQHETHKIAFELLRSNRKTLTIIVKPNGKVIVKAPIDAADDVIAAKVHKRAAWIRKQQHYFQSFADRTPPRRYISGESHLYMGRQYLLHVTEGRANTVSYKGRSFEVVCKPTAKAEKLMKEWYRERAKIKFPELAEPLIVRFKERYGVEPTSIYIQEMENRWGSCTNKGKLILNTELIKVPRPCIEYVIMHELCHLIYHNHTRQFYDLLAKEMPDWEKWKNKLELILC